VEAAQAAARAAEDLYFAQTRVNGVVSQAKRVLVSTDFHIPLFHKVYAGNVPDSTEFRSITEELASHYRQQAQADLP
jgi:hypothetical protein